MKLRTYFEREKLTPTEFAKRLNARGLGVSEFGVRKWVSGERIPRRDAMPYIQAETDGEVTPVDFYNSTDDRDDELAEIALGDALQAVGGQNALAKKLETTQSTIWHWVNKLKKVPAERVVEVETATGVPRERLRPDLYRDGAGLSSAPATRTGAIQ